MISFGYWYWSWIWPVRRENILNIISALDLEIIKASFNFLTIFFSFDFISMCYSFGPFLLCLMINFAWFKRMTNTKIIDFYIVSVCLSIKFGRRLIRLDWQRFKCFNSIPIWSESLVKWHPISSKWSDTSINVCSIRQLTPYGPFYCSYLHLNESTVFRKVIKYTYVSELIIS